MGVVLKPIGRAEAMGRAEHMERGVGGVGGRDEIDIDAVS